MSLLLSVRAPRLYPALCVKVTMTSQILLMSLLESTTEKKHVASCHCGHKRRVKWPSFVMKVCYESYD